MRDPMTDTAQQKLVPDVVPAALRALDGGVA